VGSNPMPSTKLLHFQARIRVGLSKNYAAEEAR